MGQGPPEQDLPSESTFIPCRFLKQRPVTGHQSIYKRVHWTGRKLARGSSKVGDRSQSCLLTFGFMFLNRKMLREEGRLLS